MRILDPEIHLVESSSCRSCKGQYVSSGVFVLGLFLSEYICGMYLLDGQSQISIVLTSTVALAGISLQRFKWPT